MNLTEMELWHSPVKNGIGTHREVEGVGKWEGLCPSVDLAMSNDDNEEIKKYKKMYFNPLAESYHL